MDFLLKLARDDRRPTALIPRKQSPECAQRVDGVTIAPTATNPARGHKQPVAGVCFRITCATTLRFGKRSVSRLGLGSDVATAWEAGLATRSAASIRRTIGSELSSTWYRFETI